MIFWVGLNQDSMTQSCNWERPLSQHYKTCVRLEAALQTDQCVTVHWELQTADAPDAFESLSCYTLIVLQRCLKSNTPNN